MKNIRELQANLVMVMDDDIEEERTWSDMREEGARNKRALTTTGDELRGRAGLCIYPQPHYDPLLYQYYQTMEVEPSPTIP